MDCFFRNSNLLTPVMCLSSFSVSMHGVDRATNPSCVLSYVTWQYRSCYSRACCSAHITDQCASWRSACRLYIAGQSALGFSHSCRHFLCYLTFCDSSIILPFKNNLLCTDLTHWLELHKMFQCSQRVTLRRILKRIVITMSAGRSLASVSDQCMNLLHTCRDLHSIMMLAKWHF